MVIFGGLANVMVGSFGYGQFARKRIAKGEISPKIGLDSHRLKKKQKIIKNREFCPKIIFSSLMNLALIPYYAIKRKEK